MIKSYKARRTVVNTIIYVILTILSIIWILPLVWIVMTSFSGEEATFIDHVVPTCWTFDNYIELFTNTKVFDYPRAFLNTSVRVSVVSFNSSSEINVTVVSYSSK